MEPFVIDNKRAKIFNTVGCIIVLPFVCALIFIFCQPELTELALLIGTAFGLISAVVSFVGIPYVRVVVSDTTFTIKRAFKEESYLIGDYQGPDGIREISPGRYGGGDWITIRWWVFCKDGYLKKVKATGLSPDEFIRISDAIRVRQYKMLSDPPVEEGRTDGRYKGLYHRTDLRPFFLFVAIMAIALILMVLVLLLSNPQFSKAEKIAMIGLCIFIPVASAILSVIKMISEKKADLRRVKVLKVDRQFLSINDEYYEVPKIRELYMTHPYLRDLPGVRCLVFRYGDEKKYVRYILEPRPQCPIRHDRYYQSIYNTVLAICKYRGVKVLEDEPRALTYANPQAFRSRT